MYRQAFTQSTVILNLAQVIASVEAEPLVPTEVAA